MTRSCVRAPRRWTSLAYLTAGVPLGIVPSLQEVVTIGASLKGWGAVCNHRCVCGERSRERSMDHIKLLEMCAVFFGPETLPPGADRPSCTCALGQHFDGFHSESPTGHEVRELATVHSRYPHLVTPTVCITEGCLSAGDSQSGCR